MFHVIYSRFLHDLAQIPYFSERCFCLIFQSTFTECLSAVDNSLSNIRMVCQVSPSSGSFHPTTLYILYIFDLWSMTFALTDIDDQWRCPACPGTYPGLWELHEWRDFTWPSWWVWAGDPIEAQGCQNQSEGDQPQLAISVECSFSLSLLQDSTSSLLGYLVRQYVTLTSPDSKDPSSPEGTPSDIKARMPLPEPSDIIQASNVNFDEIEQELKKISTSVDGLWCTFFIAVFSCEWYVMELVCFCRLRETCC